MIAPFVSVDEMQQSLCVKKAYILFPFFFFPGSILYLWNYPYVDLYFYQSIILCSIFNLKLTNE